MIDGWDLGPPMILHWALSLIIGVFHFFRILVTLGPGKEGVHAWGHAHLPVPQGTALA